MKLETVKVDLGHGDYAVIYKDVLRVTARLHEAELRKHMTPVEVTGRDGAGRVLLSELEKEAISPKMDYLVDLASIDDDAINEIYIFNQVTEWSFGPIDRQTLDTKVTREQYKTLVKEMDRLYKPLPLSSASPAASA